MPKYNPMFMSSDTRYEVQRTNHFYVVLQLDGIAGIDANDIQLAIESTGLPSIANDPIELAYGNSRVKVAGQANVEDITITLKDFIESDIEGALLAWRNKVYNPETGMVGWAADYKRDAEIVYYGPDGTCTRAWTLQGCFPLSLDLGEMNYDGADKKLITMNLSVDNAFRAN